MFSANQDLTRRRLVRPVSKLQDPPFDFEKVIKCGNASELKFEEDELENVKNKLLKRVCILRREPLDNDGDEIWDQFLDSLSKGHFRKFIPLIAMIMATYTHLQNLILCNALFYSF